MSQTFPGVGGVQTPSKLLIPRLRSSLPATDVDGFFDLVATALQLENKVSDIPGGVEPFYQRAFPKDQISKVDQPFNGITFRVISSVMAPMDNAGNRIPRTPTVFETDDPNKDGYKCIEQEWMELATVEFTVWSKSSDTCAKLVSWFHRLLMRYANVLKYFEASGVDKFQFVGRGEDEFDTRESQEVYFSTLTYQFRFQIIDILSQRKLDKITATVNINGGGQLLTFTVPTAKRQ